MDGLNLHSSFSRELFANQSFVTVYEQYTSCGVYMNRKRRMGVSDLRSANSCRPQSGELGYGM